ncbi:C45 family autoproteolytic acyltransferase/hydolase [Cryptosporangium aurantiacum]|uniref:Isopenicillin-N N-acyltransferase like protein n=1 Tax=Cryptosporangium aurantiacum TaxID=134849 RepID=A0A1M7RJ48_9ACTN|nr:C45 family peptidase [Cryptosporangium aurantiacum]SHN46323.1 isopenicillin-N N-acyltransferase like protein [Cryptosporangium aurantiacum]
MTRPEPLFVEIDAPTPRERGRQHGEQAAAAVVRSRDRYAEYFGTRLGLPWARVQELAELWIPPTRDLAPDLLEEMDGIAESTGLTLPEVVALNGRGEIVYDATFATMDAEPDNDGCTSFSLAATATGDQRVYAGQNWDWYSSVEDTIAIVRIVQEGKPTIVMQTEAGQIGRQGANSAGLALNANGLGGRFGATVGVLQTVIRRLVLETSRIYDAIRIPFALRQHIAANLLLTYRNGFSINLETTPQGHRWRFAQDGLITHANHYQLEVPPAIAEDYRPFTADSIYRDHLLERSLRDPEVRAPGGDTLAGIKHALSDPFGAPYGVASIGQPRSSGGAYARTVASSIVDLTTGEYHFVLGVPEPDSYRLLPWNLYDGPTFDGVNGDRSEVCAAVGGAR